MARGAIAIGTQDYWYGVYNHYDSNPTTLGQRFWEEIRKEGLNNIIYKKLKNKINPITNEKEEILISWNHNDPLYHEWVYILNPAKKEIVVLTSVKARGSHKDYDGNAVDNYVFKKVGNYSLDDAEPNWSEVEEQGNKLKEEAKQKYIKKENA